MLASDGRLSAGSSQRHEYRRWTASSFSLDTLPQEDKTTLSVTETKHINKIIYISLQLKRSRYLVCSAVYGEQESKRQVGRRVREC